MDVLEHWVVGVDSVVFVLLMVVEFSEEGKQDHEQGLEHAGQHGELATLEKEEGAGQIRGKARENFKWNKK